MVLRFAAVFVLALCALSAQQLPADQQAYRDAAKIADPEARIQAYRRVIRMGRRSDAARRSRVAILKTTVKTWPQDSRRIRRAAKSAIKAPRRRRAAQTNEVAWLLFENSAELPFAESIMRRALRRHNAAPRADLLDTLGQIQWKLGHADDAERTLTEALRLSPTLGESALVLATIAQRRGDTARALSLALDARINGAADPAHLLESLWSQSHPAASLDTALDDLYRRRFPSPIPATHYDLATRPTQRVVLAELFTGAGCGPCVGADVAFDALLDRYPRQALAVLMYHQHIPRPDPLANADTAARGAEIALRGVPTYVIDGKKDSGGGGREEAPAFFKDLDKMIATALAVPAAARLTLEATLTPTTLTVHAAGAPAQHTLNLVLAERHIRYTGENGIRFHPMVVRARKSFASPDATWTLDLPALSASLRRQLNDYQAKGHRGDSFTFRATPTTLDPANLALVAFVEDPATHRILQSASLHLTPNQTARLEQKPETAPAAAPSQPAMYDKQPENPVTWTADLPSPHTARLTAAIAPGWHLYALDQREGGPIPTRITLPGGQKGTVQAPEPVVKKDPNFGIEVGFYEKAVEFRLPFSSEGNAPGGPLKIQVRYQTCNDKLCLPPKTITVEAQ